MESTNPFAYIKLHNSQIENIVIASLLETYDLIEVAAHRRDIYSAKSFELLSSISDVLQYYMDEDAYNEWADEDL